jgi:hypothetical protein
MYDKKNLPVVPEYVLQELWHLNEIKEYSDKEDKDYYNDWYADAARDFSNDPTGVVSFVLRNTWVATTRKPHMFLPMQRTIALLPDG